MEFYYLKLNRAQIRFLSGLLTNFGDSAEDDIGEQAARDLGDEITRALQRAKAKEG